MNYPLISEYVEAIKSSEDNFEQLKNLRPVLGEDGNPVMSGGNFAVVFKMKDEQTGKLHAVKCFTKEQEGRAEAYREITKELRNVSSPYLVSIQYLEKELFVDSDQTTETEFPVILMDWVEGKALDKYLRENLDDRYALEMLAYRFSQLAQWLIHQSFAHGDLKPDNILVRDDGSLVLVDYDGMYVPAMKGQKARELGSPDFRHPLRTEIDFDEHIDDFPLASIILSLKVISINSLSLEEYGGQDRLLFSHHDYQDLAKAKLMHYLVYLLPMQDFARTYTLFMTLITKCGDNSIVENMFNNLMYDIPFPTMLSQTKVLKKDTCEFIMVGNDKYSSDRKRLIRGYSKYVSHKLEICNGTVTICDGAFSGTYQSDGSGWCEMDVVVIPETIKIIGRNPFAFCSVQLICLSPYFIVENNVLYTADKQLLIGFYGSFRLEHFDVPEGVREIGDYAFAGYECLKSINLPSSVESIGNSAFLGCKQLKNIHLSSCLQFIGKSAFLECYNLGSIELPEGLISIGSYAFYDCWSLQSITIPSTVINIGVNPFVYDKGLIISCNSCLFEVHNNTLYTKGKNLLISCLAQDEPFIIPNEVTLIGSMAFWGCPFKELYIHNNIIHLGKVPFDGCYYESFPHGYSMKLLVSKGRLNWFRQFVDKKMTILEVNDV